MSYYRHARGGSPIRDCFEGIHGDYVPFLETLERMVGKKIVFDETSETHPRAKPEQQKFAEKRLAGMKSGGVAYLSKKWDGHYVEVGFVHWKGEPCVDICNEVGGRKFRVSHQHLSAFDPLCFDLGIKFSCELVGFFEGVDLHHAAVTSLKTLYADEPNPFMKQPGRPCLELRVFDVRVLAAQSIHRFLGLQGREVVEALVKTQGCVAVVEETEIRKQGSMFTMRGETFTATELMSSLLKKAERNGDEGYVLRFPANKEFYQDSYKKYRTSGMCKLKEGFKFNLVFMKVFLMNGMTMPMVCEKRGEYLRYIDLVDKKYNTSPEIRKILSKLPAVFVMRKGDEPESFNFPISNLDVANTILLEIEYTDVSRNFKVSSPKYIEEFQSVDNWEGVSNVEAEARRSMRWAKANKAWSAARRALGNRDLDDIVLPMSPVPLESVDPSTPPCPEPSCNQSLMLDSRDSASPAKGCPFDLDETVLPESPVPRKSSPEVIEPPFSPRPEPLMDISCNQTLILDSPDSGSLAKGCPLESEHDKRSPTSADPVQTPFIGWRNGEFVGPECTDGISITHLFWHSTPKESIMCRLEEDLGFLFNALAFVWLYFIYHKEKNLTNTIQGIYFTVFSAPFRGIDGFMDKLQEYIDWKALFETRDGCYYWKGNRIYMNTVLFDGLFKYIPRPTNPRSPDVDIKESKEAKEMVRVLLKLADDYLDQRERWADA